METTIAWLKPLVSRADNQPLAPLDGDLNNSFPRRPPSPDFNSQTDVKYSDPKPLATYLVPPIQMIGRWVITKLL